MRFSQVLIPGGQRHTVEDLYDSLDLGRGDTRAKRSGFLILLLLSAIVAICGVLTDSTATVIGAMIIAPLSTPILGIALGIVTGWLGLVLRSIGWVLAGLAIVVVLGILFTNVIADPSSLSTNSQISGRTSPGLLDMVAALATGFAGAFAMCRKDLSVVLPGVAISISLVPPLGVVGVCIGEGEWGQAFGALTLFLSNVLALVIAGSVVFTLAGFAREPSSLPTAKRRRAYTVVGVATALVLIPLALNTVWGVLLSTWANDLRTDTTAWLADTDGGEVETIHWNGVTVTAVVTTPDGQVPELEELSDLISEWKPDFVSVVVDVSVASEHVID